MEYLFKEIEAKWQMLWEQENVYAVAIDPHKPKCYVLDMFPYPSGAGLHVGHPLGYVASDIYARYKKLKGFNVLHPMGYDAFGLPAEQFAIDNGIHPADSTNNNIENFRLQLKQLGFCYDWSRELKTSDPTYYRWTQWIFIRFFNSWYNPVLNKAEPINQLLTHFEQNGNTRYPYTDEHKKPQTFDALQWKQFTPAKQAEILMHYRIAYLAHTDVNWCEALGTVLANDEVINGLSYRGGHPVTKKKMQQWNLRITAYAERLLEGLDRVDFSSSMKDIQRNWIGKSIGAEIYFNVKNIPLAVFTTRPDTLFGVDFIVLAPEHPAVLTITQSEQAAAVLKYIEQTKTRSELDRLSNTQTITGCFTGAYALHPLTQKQLPVWVADYVLAHYGTGSIMGVPCGDERDFAFAQHFNLPISNIWGTVFDGTQPITSKTIPLQNSGLLTGHAFNEAIPILIAHLEQKKLGLKKINYKMRDAGWSRQRYWGEPFPIVYQEGIAQALSDDELPLTLPPLNSFLPADDGQGPLARLQQWIHPFPNTKRDSNTMPTHAGAAWYFLRFMDPHNVTHFASKQALNYWNQVDVYVGGSEHAVAHLLYARLWVKILFDLDYLTFDEPFKKLINQGKITGSSRFVYRIRGTNQYVSFGLKTHYVTDALHVDVSLVDGFVLDTDALKNWKPEFSNAQFILENGQYICGSEIEKMSKSKYNTVNPSALVARYGADVFRMYEMFLGPIEASKPWDTQGIEGIARFLKKCWKLFFIDGQSQWTNHEPSHDQLKILNRTVHKVEQDMERFSFNTAVSSLMVCVNELSKTNCSSLSILKPFLIILSPFAPHMAEELWQQIGQLGFIVNAPFPTVDEQWLLTEGKNYPISINGKLRANIYFNHTTSAAEMEAEVLKNETIVKWLNQATPKKIIIVKDKMINVVV